MSVLDYLTNNWQQILGMGGSTPQAPLPGPIPPAQAGFSPSGAVDGNALGADWNSFPNVAGGGPTGPSGTAWNSMAANAGNPFAASGALPPPGATPSPSLVSSAAAAPGANLPLQQRQSVPDILASVGPPIPPGPPMSLAPPNPGAGATPMAPNGGAQPDGLSRTLGATLNPSLYKPSPMGGFLASLGGGLSTVQGNTGAGAFARGMGGALTKGNQYTQQQQTQLFNQSSAAFKDMLAARNQDDVEWYRRAQAAYLNSRAQAIQLNGGTGKPAYQNDPFWKSMKVEDTVQKYQDTQKQILLKQWSMNGTSPEQQQADLDNLQKKVDSFRQNAYKTYGMTPADGQKQLTMGQEPPTTADGKANPKFNPFPTKGMTQEDFDAKVPLGGWYLDQNGTPRQRTVAPNGDPSSSPGAQMQQYYDDTLAMTPAQ